MVISNQHEKLRIRDKTGKKLFFGPFIKGVRLLTETAFFVGVGAVKMLFERLSQLFKTVYGDNSRLISFPLLTPVHTPESVKVPLLPIDDYTRLNVEEVIKRLKDLSVAQLLTLRNFENIHKNRKSVLEAIDRFLAGETS